MWRDADDGVLFVAKRDLAANHRAVGAELAVIADPAPSVENADSKPELTQTAEVA